MTNPNFAQAPQSTEDLYRYAAGPEGSPRIDDVYKTPGDVVDVGQFAAERATDILAQDLGPVVVVTRSETPGPDGKHEMRVYELTSKYFLNPQKGQYVEVNPHDATQVQPVTIGAQWMSPMGKPTKHPVRFVARPHTRGYMESQIDPANEKPGVQSPTAVGQQHLKHFFDEDAYLG